LYTFLRKHATGQATTELHIVHVERGMSWEDALERSSEAKSNNEGFYLSHQVKKFHILTLNKFFLNLLLINIFVKRECC